MNSLIDLAAVVLPEAAMPPGFRLTNGGYLATDRVSRQGSGVLRPESAVLAYEASYEEHLGAAFMEIQVIAWAAPGDARADAFLRTEALDDVWASQGETGCAVVRVPNPMTGAMHVCSCSVTTVATTVRVVWHSREALTIDAERTIPDLVHAISARASKRAELILDGVTLSGLDLSLPLITPVFRPRANFENYLYRPDRYDDSSRPAAGFVCGYRRGFTEPWVERGQRRRLVACDVLRFATADTARLAVEEPAGLVGDWRLEHQYIPEEPDLHDCAMFAWQDSSSFWSVVLFAAVNDCVLTADVWGFESLGMAEDLSGRIVRQVRSYSPAGKRPVVVDLPF